jgi:hypothetical protein
MFRICPAAEPLAEAIRQAGVFSNPTFPRFAALMIGLVVTMGRHTVSHSLVAMRPLLRGHWCNYHRLYSSAKYSMWILAAVLVRQVVALLPADVVIELVADDTVDGKSGKHVWAQSGHRDAVRSTSSKGATKIGHKWLVLCILVHLKGWDRPWALPIMCGLCISSKVGKKLGRRQKTASQITRQMLMRLMRLLPNRKFILMGDSQVVTHETAEFARRHADRVTVVGRLRGNANLYASPKVPKRPRPGRRATKGRKLPPPQKRVPQLNATAIEIAWYGGERRTVRHVTEQALWYDKHHNAVTPIRWVGVLGEGGGQNAYFYCSDTTMSAVKILEQYVRRWNIEVTFEEARALLGLETTRHWCKQSVLRVTPILFGLFTAIILIWANLPKAQQRVLSSKTPCYDKQKVTFSDVLAAARREFWHDTLLRHSGKQRCLNILPPPLRKTLLWHLSAAA